MSLLVPLCTFRPIFVSDVYTHVSLYPYLLAHVLSPLGVARAYVPKSVVYNFGLAVYTQLLALLKQFHTRVLNQTQC